MVAKPAHSWAGVRFSSFPYLLTETAWMCSWPPLTILFCVCSCLPIAFPTRLSHPIPCFALFSYHRNHFQRTVKALPARQQFLLLVKCQGLKPTKWRVLCHLAGTSSKFSLHHILSHSLQMEFDTSNEIYRHSTYVAKTCIQGVPYI